MIYKGMKFIGKINKHPFEVLDIKIDKLSKSKMVVIKDLKCGKIIEHGYKALEHCAIEIVGIKS